MAHGWITFYASRCIAKGIINETLLNAFKPAVMIPLIVAALLESVILHKVGLASTGDLYILTPIVTVLLFLLFIQIGYNHKRVGDIDKMGSLYIRDIYIYHPLTMAITLRFFSVFGIESSFTIGVVTSVAALSGAVLISAIKRNLINLAIHIGKE